MKRVVIGSLICVLSFCQYGWGYQARAQDCSPGLVDVLTDIATAPCSLLATCLGVDDGAPCTYPQKRRLKCVPVKKPCRPFRPHKTIKKVPRGTKPPMAHAPTPGVPARPPGLTPQIPLPSTPPITTQEAVPPQREALPQPPIARPKLPGILPLPSESIPTPATPRQPTPPNEPRLGKTPARVPVPPTPGVPRKPDTPPVAPRLEVKKAPAIPKTAKTGKPSKPEKRRQWSPCVPACPPAPCMPVPPPIPCGPRLFFR
jgi:hypothetical protein